MVVGGAGTGVIGREAELRLVESFLDAAGPGAHALVLEGEAGIGKTTIWHAARESARRRGYRLIETRPTEAEARIPFAALHDLVAPLFDESRPELPAPQQAALDVALMRSDVPVGAPLQPLALSLAVLELLRVGAATRPLAIAIDDWPWLDESSAGVLRFAFRRLDTEPVIALVTQRTPAPAGLLDDLPEERLRRVSVEGLSVDAIDELLERALGLRLAPSALRRVRRMSGGNPFHAVERGRLIQARGPDALTATPLLPESMPDLVRERLASLPPAAAEVARSVAALSHPTLPLLDAVLGREPAREGLELAISAGVLARGDDPIRFAHPLLATELMGSMPEAERRDLHRRLAAVVSGHEEVARHRALAASGPDPDVADALDAAATQAHGRGAPDAAADLIEHAARLSSPDDPARGTRLATAGWYRLVAGDVARARQILEDALTEPIAAAGPSRAEILYRLAAVRQLMDDFGAAEVIGSEALEHARGDLPLTVRIKLLLAGVSFISGRRWADGARHAFEARELAEAGGDPAILAITIGPELSWRHATGDGCAPMSAQRSAEVEQWTRHFRALDLPDYAIAAIEFADGATSSAIERLRALLDRAERDGDASSLPFLLANVALADVLDGRVDLARLGIERASRLAAATEQATAQVHVLVYEARILSRLGEVDAALAAGRSAFALMETTGWRVGEWWLRVDLALLELVRGNAAAALELVAGSVGPAQSDDESPRRRWGQPVAVEALVALGRLEDARAVLHEVEAGASAARTPRLLAEAQRARARVAAAEGNEDAADAAAEEAEGLHREMGDRWELARTLLLRGEIHRRGRRRAKARAALREAFETFTVLGARLWADEAREQLGRIDALREDGGLTPTQRRVAELVAGGLTNRQAADRLFMSVHTVEAHLSAAYRALGITSRRQLGAAMARPTPEPDE